MASPSGGSTVLILSWRASLLHAFLLGLKSADGNPSRPAVRLRVLSALLRASAVLRPSARRPLAPLPLLQIPRLRFGLGWRWLALRARMALAGASGSDARLRFGLGWRWLALRARMALAGDSRWDRPRAARFVTCVGTSGGALRAGCPPDPHTAGTEPGRYAQPGAAVPHAPWRPRAARGATARRAWALHRYAGGARPPTPRRPPSEDAVPRPASGSRWRTP